ncbi:alpha/beta hydrolase [Xanthobacter dioxanivorans]|uniref:Alpha/beta hydrolase n=1 Tax=Xanthobacter dioxanivorans TaxID=2528964 RepID=A0A974SJ01_9HYPH|nr:alpha/beta hydrolase [Xanthobacter dioxanivorans]QRG05873.1 alpha/beta hydrolase [Xanthobacter dioxanivorans]
METSEIDALRALIAASPRPQTLAERRERMEAVTAIDPVDEDIRLVPVSAGGVPGEWSLAPGADAARVLLFLHGGGYSSGSLRSHRTMVTGAGRAAGIRTLAIAYRLAPEHPFPAALEDAEAAYRFLLEQGHAARQIVVGGDSAGGGLTLALFQTLRAKGLPLPACGWLVSPWVDLEMTGASIAQKDAVDPLIHRAYLDMLAQAYLGSATAPRNPLVSPLHADLSGLPPMLVQVGSAETLLDDAVRIAGRLAAFDGAVRLSVYPHMIHAWPIWHHRLAEGRRALAEAGAFMRRWIDG